MNIHLLKWFIYFKREIARIYHPFIIFLVIFLESGVFPVYSIKKRLQLYANTLCRNEKNTVFQE